MAIDIEFLSTAMGVEPALVQDAVTREPDSVVEGLGVIIADSAQRRGMVHGTSTTIEALDALQRVDWDEFDPEDRVNAVVYLVGVLGNLGLRVYSTEEQQ